MLNSATTTKWNMLFIVTVKKISDVLFLIPATIKWQPNGHLLSEGMGVGLSNLQALSVKMLQMRSNNLADRKLYCLISYS